MAILQGCPGIEVTIVSNGKTLEEYPDEEGEFRNEQFSAPPNDQMALTYIECTSDAEFAIRWEVTPDYADEHDHTHFAFWAFVDGKGIGGSIHALNGSTWTKVYGHALNRISDTELSSRKLKFCSIKKGLSSSQPLPDMCCLSSLY
jgi:hypothetical protein